MRIHTVQTVCVTLGVAWRTEGDGATGQRVVNGNENLAPLQKQESAQPLHAEIAAPGARASGHSTQFTQHSSLPSALIVTFAAKEPPPPPAPICETRKCVCVCAGAASAFWHNRFRRTILLRTRGERVPRCCRCIVSFTFNEHGDVYTCVLHLSLFGI